MRINNIEQIKQDIMDIADCFYQNRIKEGAERLPELIGLLKELAEQQEIQRQNEFAGLLNYVMEAIQQKEYVLLADILVFEIVDVI